MLFAKAYLGILLSFAIIDGLWINLVVKRLYEKELGDWLRQPFSMGAAAFFYLFYVGAVYWFCVRPTLMSNASLGSAALHGALLGALGYGTYAFTNYAILRKWTMTLVISDVLWGAFVTAAIAVIGTAVARHL